MRHHVGKRFQLLVPDAQLFAAPQPFLGPRADPRQATDVEGPEELGLAPGNSGPNVVNGDYIYDAEYTTDQTQASGALAGYASPPGL